MKRIKAAGLLLALILVFAYMAPVALAAQSTIPDVSVTPSVVLGVDKLTMKIDITNHSDTDVSIFFPTAERYDFRLYSANRKILYNYGSGRVYAQRASTVTIRAGKTLTFSDTVSGEKFKQIKNKLSHMKAFVTGSADFINEYGYTMDFDSSMYITVTPKAVLKRTYAALSLTIRNTSLRQVSIKHYSGQKFEFELLDKYGNVLYTWSEGRKISESGSTTKVGINSSLTWSATLSGSTYKAIKSKIASVRAYVVGNADFIDDNGYTAAVVK